jgi:lysophospholipase L1-like esterase
MTRLAVTIHFAQCPAEITGHPGSRTTSYIVNTDRTTEERFLDSIDTVHWYFLTGIDVWTDRQHRAIVTLGDSLTDGRGSTTDGHDRWPDLLSRRLRAFTPTVNTAVLNHGIGGNAVLEGGLGPTAIQRFERDVLDQPGVRFVILLEGVNDIGTSLRLDTVADRLIAAFGHFIQSAHERNVLVFGATILPFQGSQYSGDEQERVRQTVNEWIRTGGQFDAVIDFAQVVSDPRKRDVLMTDYDCDDHLHLSPKGYRRMAESIDLELFVR